MTNPTRHLGTAAAQVVRLLELAWRRTGDALAAIHDAGTDTLDRLGELADAPRAAYRQQRLEHYRRDLTPDELVVDEQLERIARNAHQVLNNLGRTVGPPAGRRP